MRVGIDISFLNTLKEKQGVHRYALGFIREITKDNKKRFQIYTNSKTYNESKKKFSCRLKFYFTDLSYPNKMKEN